MVYVDADICIGGRGLVRCGQGEGRVKNRQIFADILYGQPLMYSVGCTVMYICQSTLLLFIVHY